MHSVTPYLVRSFKERNKEKKESDFHNLHSVNHHSLLELIYKYMQSRSANVYDFPEDKRVYNFQNVSYDKARHTVTAFMQVGKYGVKKDIIDKHTGKQRFPQTEDDADILKHFIQFTIPPNATEGIALFHKSHGVGIKTLFDKLFKPVFLRKTKAVLQVTPYAHSEALQNWTNSALVKEIVVKGYVPSSDIAENVGRMGEVNTEFSITPKRQKKGKIASLGKLKGFVTKQPSPERQMVETLSQFGSSIKTVAELNGVKRTFEVGNLDKSGPSCDITITEDDDVELDGGQPVFNSIRKWCVPLTNDILKGVYGKRSFQIKAM